MPIFWTRLFRVALIVYGLVLGVGLAIFIPASPQPVTQVLGPAPEPGGERRNLALAERGGVVRASSTESNLHQPHHVAYVNDGRETPTRREKWVSAVGDTWPWLEILLEHPYQIDEVVIDHAGRIESHRLTVGNYDVTCYAPGDEEPLALLEVRDNRARRAEHPIDCPGADRLRLTFDMEGLEEPRDVARIYEVEVWGR